MKMNPEIRNGQHLTEVIEGPNAVDEAIASLSSKVKNEVCSFIVGRHPPPERLRKARELNSQMYRRGVRSRTIYLDEAREHKPTLEHVHWLNDQGAAVRTLADLPMQMIVFDGKVAVLPFLSKNRDHAIIIHSDSGVVYCLQALFELVWATASPLGQIFDRNGNEVSIQDRTLLEMLSLGRIDKEISKDIGVSVRTVASNVARLMSRLEAKTRFAAGVQAAKRNWV